MYSVSARRREFYYKMPNIGQRGVAGMGVIRPTAPADSTIQGVREPTGASRLPENIIFTVRPCSISGICGFALFDQFVGTDSLDRTRIARNVLDFFAWFLNRLVILCYWYYIYSELICMLDNSVTVTHVLSSSRPI